MAARRPWVHYWRDMILIDCHPQAGRETRPIHPLLVLSPKAFNERTGIVIGLPMTTAAFNKTNPFAAKFVSPPRKASYILGHASRSRSTGVSGKRSLTRGSKFRKIYLLSRAKR